MEAFFLTLAATALSALPAGWIAAAAGRRMLFAHGAMVLVYGFVCLYALTALGAILGIVTVGGGSGLEPAGVLMSLGSVPLWLAVRAMADGDTMPLPRRGADPIFHSVRRSGGKALRR